MKKYVLKLLTLGLVIISCLAFAGCGSNAGDKYTGTWIANNSNDNDIIESYFVIEKSKDNDKVLIATKYSLFTNTFKFGSIQSDKKYHAEKTQKMMYLKGDNAEINGVVYSIVNGKLASNGDSEYQKISDKSMTFDEMNKDRGFPEPK